MPNDSGNDRDELVRRLFVGAPSAEDEDALRGDAEARRELEALRSLARELDRAAEEERATLELASGLRDSPGADRVAPTLEQLASSSDGGGAAVFRFPGVLLAAAALLAAVIPLALYWGGRGAGPEDDLYPEDVYLGRPPIELEQPLGPVEGYGSFAWSFGLSTGGWFELRIWRADEPRTADPLVHEPSLTDPAWTPSPEQRALLAGGDVRWEVRAFGPDGRLQRAAIGEASLSSSAPR